MKKPFFIMLYQPNNEIIYPLVYQDEYENEYICQYSSYEEANKVAKNSFIGKNFGYQIFKM